MVYEELVSSMEEAAEQKNREMLERAGRDADQVIHDAENDALSIRNQYLQSSIRQAGVERNRQTYLASEEVKSAISTIKENLLQEAFSMAAETLRDIRGTPGYPDLYRRLLEEAVREISGKNHILHIDIRDKDLCSRIIADLNLAAVIKPDIESAGGLVVSSDDERISVHNTIEARLEKARDVHRLEIIRELTGG